MNKAELIEALVDRGGLRKADAARVIDALFGPGGVIAAELKRGGRVQITGFGSFLARRRSARTGRDPRSGRAIPIKASVAPLFRAGQALKGVLNRKR